MNYADCAIVIPCHNEENSIAQTIEEVLSRIPGGFILVVDNNSSDLTYEKASKAGATVIREPRKGKGFAFRRALTFLNLDQFNLILMVDGDATYSLDSFEKAYNLIIDGNYDMVVGTRIIGLQNKFNRQDPFRKFHVFGNNLLTKLNRIFLKLEIKDTLSGWRCLSKGFAKSFNGGASGFELEAELNAHAFVLSCGVANIEVEYRGRMQNSSSKLNTFSDGAKILRKQFHFFRAERPILAYSSLALPWFIFSIYLIRNVLIRYFESNSVPNFPSLIAGVASFIVSALLWTTGLILENVRLARVQSARQIFVNL